LYLSGFYLVAVYCIALAVLEPAAIFAVVAHGVGGCDEPVAHVVIMRMNSQADNIKQSV